MTPAGVATMALPKPVITVSSTAQAWGGQDSLVQQRSSLEASRLGPDTSGVTSLRAHCPAGPMRHVLAVLSEFLGDSMLQLVRGALPPMLPPKCRCGVKTSHQRGLWHPDSALALSSSTPEGDPRSEA